MTVDIAAAPKSSNRHSISALWFVAMVLMAVLLGALDGDLAFVIESPGSSLVGPVLLVALLAVTACGVGWWFLRDYSRFPVWIIVGTLATMGILATWWAWAFAMPAAIAWDPNATPDALTALKGIPPDQSVCKFVTTGSIGALNAPYERCALDGPLGAQVEYTPGETGDRGLLFFEGSHLVGSDQYVRHLAGHWFAFNEGPPGIPGYTFTGGI